MYRQGNELLYSLIPLEVKKAVGYPKNTLRMCRLFGKRITKADLVVFWIMPHHVLQNQSPKQFWATKGRRKKLIDCINAVEADDLGGW